MKEFLSTHPEVCEKIELEIRDNAHKLLSPQALKAAQVSGRAAAPAVDVSAADFDED